MNSHLRIGRFEVIRELGRGAQADHAHLRPGRGSGRLRRHGLKRLQHVV